MLVAHSNRILKLFKLHYIPVRPNIYTARIDSLTIVLCYHIGLHILLLLLDGDLVVVTNVHICGFVRWSNYVLRNHLAVVHCRMDSWVVQVLISWLPWSRAWDYLLWWHLELLLHFIRGLLRNWVWTCVIVWHWHWATLLRMRNVIRSCLILVVACRRYHMAWNQSSLINQAYHIMLWLMHRLWILLILHRSYWLVCFGTLNNRRGSHFCRTRWDLSWVRI